MVVRARFWVLGAVAATAMTAGLASFAQEPKTTTEKIKEKLGDAAASVKKGAISAEEAIKDQFTRARDSITKMGVESRVYARLHWDKDLASSKIDLSAPKLGSIKLMGTVPDAKAKAKALSLTMDTVGVTNVVDELTIVSTTTVVEPAKP